MARDKKMKIGVLNIKSQPHSPDTYIKLLQDVFDMKQSVKLQASEYGMLGSINLVKRQDTYPIVTGFVYKFINIDPTKPWLDTERLQSVTTEETTEVVIPPNFKPNLTMLRYVFYPEHHRLFFQAQSKKDRLGFTTARKLFSSLFALSEVAREFVALDVIVEPSREKLAEIFEIPDLRRLTMRITRPNPDDLGLDFEDEVFDRMNLQNIEQEDISYKAVKGTSITPNDRTKMLAEVAASNGYVFGHGYDLDGKIQDIKTIDHPYFDQAIYDDNLTPEHVAFFGKCNEMMETIRGWFRRS